ncbi:ParB N-terminal domain-containing protein [Flectobacillus roseus]|uniref:ParB/Sulfiredoxin domain-containing protein n=1 Tax=Flectobacillus roseus TaxID=502259 RepID=A0ABT6YE45_9BACT|nr:hypothetical protein [Flectobacillus roseus]MDI9861859.1 hypothetical protein [Flectobacillus roseus]
MKANFKDVIASKTKQALGSNLISLEAIKQNIQILEELRDFIPPLSEEESQQLEQNILKYGCKDALLVWETTRSVAGLSITEDSTPAYILIDGHNRYRICQTNQLNFNIQLLSFNTLKEVKDYMIDLQLGRRNLTPQQASYFRGLRYNNEKTERGKYDRITDEGLINVDDYFESKRVKISTASKLSEEYKVSPATIRRDAEFAEGLGKLSTTLRNEVLAGNQNIEKGLLQKVAKVKELPKPIESADELVTVLQTSGLVEKTEAVPIDHTLVNCSNEIIALVKKIVNAKDKEKLNDLKNLVSKLEELL